MRLRVAHLVPNFPPEFRGGIENYVAQLVLLQKAAGLEPVVVTGSDKRSKEESSHEEHEGVPVVRVFRREDESYQVLFRPPRILDVMRRLLARLEPDLVHVHHWFNFGDTLLQSLEPRAPVVATFHDAYSHCPRFFFLRPDGFYCGNALPIERQRCVDCIRPDDGHADLEGRVAERRAGFAREIDRVAVALAPSAFHASLLERAGVVPTGRLRVLPLGLGRIPVRRKWQPEPGRLRLLLFGNLSRLKGVDLLLAAMLKLDAGDRIELHLHGRPLAAEEAALRALAHGLRVTWHGDYDLERLADAAARIDLGVFPSRAYETYGMVVEEALAIGLPLIVSDRGAPARRVDSTYARIVPVEDERPLTAALRDLLEHPEQIASMRAALPASPHRLADHERALREIYVELVRGRSGTTP